MIDSAFWAKIAKLWAKSRSPEEAKQTDEAVSSIFDEAIHKRRPETSLVDELMIFSSEENDYDD